MAINEVNNDLSEEDVKAFEETTEGETKEEETKKEDESSAETPAEASTAGIKDVPGETPRERALRAELTRVRRANREKEQGELLNVKPEVVANNDIDEELRNLGYEDEQIPGLKRLVDVIATNSGYVKKETTLKEQADDVLTDFIEEHPEYSPENDKDDLYWSRFKEIIQSDYNLSGKNPKQLKSIFQKVDRDVKDILGEKQLDKDKIEAKKRKIGDISHGTTSTEKSVTQKKAIQAGNKTFVSSSHPNLVFKGFDDEEIEEFLTN